MSGAVRDLVKYYIYYSLYMVLFSSEHAELYPHIHLVCTICTLVLHPLSLVYFFLERKVSMSPCGVVVSVLATGPKGCGFEPGQGNGFFRAIKNPQHIFLLGGK
jgi:hypothetical protein